MPLSKLCTVDFPIPASEANWSCDQSINTRAARTWEAVRRVAGACMGGSIEGDGKKSTKNIQLEENVEYLQSEVTTKYLSDKKILIYKPVCEG
jgi:hypothetical protein